MTTDPTPEPSEDQERSDERLSPREAALTAAEKRLGDYLKAQHGLALASSDSDKHPGIEYMWQRIGASYGSFWHLATIVLDAALPHLRDSGREAAYRAGREDAAEADTPLLDALRRLRDSWYRQPGWTDAADTVDVLIDAFSEQRAAALARGQQQREEPWQIRAAATGGGPCPTCRKPFWTHVCLSCSPDYQTPGKGCVNCRDSGMDQTPCKPAVDSIASQHTQDGVR